MKTILLLAALCCVAALGTQAAVLSDQPQVSPDGKYTASLTVGEKANHVITLAEKDGRTVNLTPCGDIQTFYWAADSRNIIFTALLKGAPTVGITQVVDDLMTWDIISPPTTLLEVSTSPDAPRDLWLLFEKDQQQWLVCLELVAEPHYGGHTPYGLVYHYRWPEQWRGNSALKYAGEDCYRTVPAVADYFLGL